MTSLRQLASCIGLSGNFSVVRHFFGYASAPPWNLLPSQGNLPQSLSLLTQMKRLKRKHFHLNVIRVGTDANGLLEPLDEQNLDCAVQLTRDIYGAAGIGIGRVERWWAIPASEDTGYDAIDGDWEAIRLVNTYYVDNDGVDCFFVEVYLDGAGYWAGSGVVVESQAQNPLGTGRTMAHELGHYLLGSWELLVGFGHHEDDPNNLMTPGGDANPMPGSTELTSEQIDTMKDHDDMKGPC